MFRVRPERGFAANRQRNFFVAAIAMDLLSFFLILLCACCLPFYWMHYPSP
jgi:hypothetical protein